MAGDLSSYEIEGAAQFRSTEDLAKRAYEEITKECENREERIAETGVTMPSFDNQVSHPPTSRPSAPDATATSPQTAADILAFTVFTRDFLDSILPRIRVKIIAKCNRPVAAQPPVRPSNPYKIVSWFAVS